MAGDPDAPLARESLAELCNAYWYPLYAYIRRRGYDAEKAKDLTQDFFARALEKGLFGEADPARGRFRSFLRKVCADFLANRHDWEHARKRGGGLTIQSIDAAGAEFTTYYYYTLLRMYLAGHEDYKEIAEDARLEDRAHFELIVPRIYELGASIPRDIREFADRAGCPDAYLPDDPTPTNILTVLLEADR